MPKIHTLDLHFQGLPQVIAAYLVEGETGLALVETGPSSTLPWLKKGITQAGFELDDIKHLLLTHIHFDHAGAAGWWAERGAHIYVHHNGAPHLIDPERLIKSATRIYQDQMETLWGEFLSVPATQLTALYDEQIIQIGDLRFEALDTPGHARHHMAYRLGEVAFTGDVAGIRLTGLPIIDIPTPPPEFSVEVWQDSLDRLQAQNFQGLYPTHFGLISEVDTHLQTTRQMVSEVADLTKTWRDQGLDREAMIAAFQAWQTERMQAVGLTDFDIQRYELGNPAHMSIDGMLRYWRKREERT